MKLYYRWAAAALSVAVLAVSSAVAAAPVSGQGTWETTLQGRDLDGNLNTAEAYYDTSLNITWLADANYAGAVMDWSAANAWAVGLNPYGSGIIGWRLASVIDKDGPDADLLGDDGCDYSYSGGTDCGFNVDVSTGEMAHMFYVTLGNKGEYDTDGNRLQQGWGLINTGNFFNIQPHVYWSATEYAQHFLYGWDFNFYYGNQFYDPKTINSFYGWAVHDGDVGAVVVPVPAAVWLFVSGLAGLIGFASRKKAA